MLFIRVTVQLHNTEGEVTLVHMDAVKQLVKTLCSEQTKH